MTTPDRWICVNVGVDGVDIMAKEMSIVWLVVDFFSNYHRSEVAYCDEQRKANLLCSIRFMHGGPLLSYVRSTDLDLSMRILERLIMVWYLRPCQWI